MGNYLDKPIVDKHSMNGFIDEYPYRWSVSEMQGWRNHMEDTYYIDFNVSSPTPMFAFGVYDGHGGSQIARYVSANIKEILSDELKKFGKDYSAALKSTYLTIDKRLWMDESYSELLDYSTRKSRSPTFNEVYKPEAPVVTFGRVQELAENEISAVFSPSCMESENVEHLLFDAILSRKDTVLGNGASLDSIASEETGVSQCAAKSISSEKGLIRENSSRLRYLSNSVSDVEPNTLLLETSAGRISKEDEPVASPPVENGIKEKIFNKTVPSGLDGNYKQVDYFKHLKQRVSELVTPLKNRLARNSGKTKDSTGGRRKAGCLLQLDHDSSEDSTLEDADAGGMWCFNNFVSNAFDSMKRAMGIWKYNYGPPTSLAMLSGCTAVTCLMTETAYIVANAGDSRCVLCRGTKAIDLSIDHKPELLEEQSRIYSAGGYLYMGRVNGNLNLTRALGDLIYKQNPSLPPEKQIVSAFPDVTVTSRTDEDEFLIIGCDGIWEQLSSQEIVNFVYERISRCTNLSDILESLFQVILSPNPEVFECGCDNMTAIIVDLKKHRES